MAREDPRDKDTRGQRTSEGRTGPAGDSGGGGRASDNTPTDNILDRIFGYKTLGQRRAAYNNNPNRPGGRNITPVAMVPSFPNASPSVVAGAIFDALTMGSLPGVAGMFGRAIKSGVTGDPVSSGWGMDAALAMGGTRGKQGPDVGVGNDRGGQGGNAQFTAPWMPKPALQATKPITSPTPASNQPAQPSYQAPWMARRRYIPGPSSYGITLPAWS